MLPSKILWFFLSLYGVSAWCADGLQVKAEGKRPFKDTKAGMITQYGSGVYVTDHLILTCFHCVENGVDFFYKTKGGKWKAGKLYAWDKDNDLALVYTDEVGKPAEIVKIPALTISGSAGDRPVTNTAASLNNATLYVGPYDESKNEKEESTKLCGSSGSPIFAEGRLIGIVKTQLNKRVKDYKPDSGDMPPGVYVIITSVETIETFVNSVEAVHATK